MSGVSEENVRVRLSEPCSHCLRAGLCKGGFRTWASRPMLRPRWQWWKQKLGKTSSLFTSVLVDNGLHPCSKLYNMHKMTSCETDWIRRCKHFKWKALITTPTFMFSSHLTTKTTCTVETIPSCRHFQRMSTICGSMVRANNPVKIPWGTMWLASTTMWITNHLH